MKLRMATFNVENLFTRPRAMRDGSGAAGQAAINDHAELNRIIAEPAYDAADKARLIELDKTYGFSALNTPAAALVLLNKVRGQLYSRSQAGVVSVVAAGRDDWTGWFFLRTDDLSWEALFNTGRYRRDRCADPDLRRSGEPANAAALQRPGAGCQVQQGIPARDAHRRQRRAGHRRGHPEPIPDPLGDQPYRRSQSKWRAHVFQGLPGIRDRSSGWPQDRRAAQPFQVQARRQHAGHAGAPQGAGRSSHAIAVAALEHAQLALIGGDLNDTPDQPLFAALWQDGFVDVKDHPSYPTDRPGTFDTGTAANKIDYLIMSPKLRDKLTGTGIERRGSYHPHSWVPFNTVTKKADEASDHQLVWADFSL